MRAIIRELITREPQFRQAANNPKGRPKGRRNSADADAFTGTFPKLRIRLTPLDIFGAMPITEDDGFTIEKGAQSKRHRKME